MPEINYKELSSYLDKHPSPEPVILIYGDEYLYKGALKTLLDAMLPGKLRKTAYEPAGDENVTDALEGLFTLSFFSQKKVVHLADSRLFYSRDDAKKFLTKAGEEAGKNMMDKAASYFMKYLAHTEISLDDLSSDYIQKHFADDENWMTPLVDHCKAAGLTPPKNADLPSLIEDTLERTFPKGNHLVITTDLADKRRTLFKSIKKTGLIVDCSVPKGERMADKKEQEVILKERIHSILEPRKKTIAPTAYTKMTELIGFDLRTFAVNLEKLVSYIGDAPTITVKDVESVVNRTKTDPVFELTNALMERNAEKALLCLDSLLNEDYHPLQALAALVNQMRRMLVAKDVVENTPGVDAVQSAQFQVFKNAILPLVHEKDEQTSNWALEWDEVFKKQEGKRKKKKADTDLLAAGKKSPYPVYLALKNTSKYTMDELIRAHETLGEADLAMKSSTKDPRLVLENAVLSIITGN